MSSNVQFIYGLIESDLKAAGWSSDSIAAAISECQRERRSTDADENTLCVKEMSYLRQESLQKVAKRLNKKSRANIIVRIKRRIVDLAQGFWHLNWEAKIGVFCLIPPILGTILFIVDSMYVPRVYGVYIGLMAIAGAYLIKGNLIRKE